jgi:predicted AlkP superfamily pyrophosphatase or phosphodiesterase
MIVIPVQIDSVDGSISASQPIPDNAVLIVIDAVNYTVYEPGDTLPTAIT